MSKLEIRLKSKPHDQVRDRAFQLKKTVSTYVRNLIELDLGGQPVPGRPPARPAHPNAARLGEVRDGQRETISEIIALRELFTRTQDIELCNKIIREVRATITIINDEIRR